MELPHDRLYSEYHLWVKMEKDQAVIGITDYAREELGEVDYIELPQVDDVLSREQTFRDCRDKQGRHGSGGAHFGNSSGIQ